MTFETTTAPAADSAPISLDQAAERAIERRKAAEAAPAEAVEDTIQDASGPDDAGDDAAQESDAATQAADDNEGEPEEANADVDDAETEEPATPAIDPPQFWDADGKERFAKLSPEVQKEVLAYEKQRTAAVAVAMQKSTETQKAYGAKLQQLQAVSEQIGEVVDEGESSVRGWQDRMQQWEDWFVSDEAAELAQTDPDAYRAQESRHRQEQIAARRTVQQVQALKEKKEAAEKAAFAAYAAEQTRLLPELAPELADPKEGPARQEALRTYLTSKGLAPETVRGISALEAAIAYKAMRFDAVPNLDEVVRKAALYDRANAAAKTPPKPKQAQAGPTVAPTGQGQAQTSAEARFKQLSAKKSLSVDEATERAMLRRQIKR